MKRTAVGRRALLGGMALLPWIPASLAAQSAAQTDPVAQAMAALRTAALPLASGPDGFGGAGWELVLAEARGAAATLIGEDHGVAEAARLAQQLFGAMAADGYNRFGLELSPAQADGLERAARAPDLDAARRDIMRDGWRMPFFMLREEAELARAAVRAAGTRPGLLKGYDRDIGSDVRILTGLRDRAPAAARPLLERAIAEAEAGWRRFRDSASLLDLFAFSTEPALAGRIRAAWPGLGGLDAAALASLEATLRENAVYRGGGTREGYLIRAAFNRSRFAADVREAAAAGRPLRPMLKFGWNHMVRGRNYAGIFDLGAMVAEHAELQGGRSFHLAVVPGPSSRQAVIDPRTLRYRPAASAEQDEPGIGAGGLGTLLGARPGDGHRVIDLRQARGQAGIALERASPDLARTIHGFDVAIVFDGATASTEL